ncbi:MAG: hypothetical protein GX119_01360 [Syntrophomonadaceae bacterium]|jgi:hypothetical protein|nr:hypothetical protein [Syntrophomonadaceae bacterium]
MRTLVATMMPNSKGKNVFCSTNKVSEQQMRIIRNTDWSELEGLGFTFINLTSPEYPNIRGKAIFFEGHLDEMGRALRSVERSVN